jgi:hypothetical protein
MSSSRRPKDGHQRSGGRRKAPVGADKRQAARQDAWRMLLGALAVILTVPLIFWLQHGVVNGFAWGVTAFLAAICLLAAVGIYFSPLSKYHTPVRLRGNWSDIIGSFWMVSCVVSLAVSWFVTAATTITADSWESVYRYWVAISILLPLVTAAPLFRYLRGRSILVGLPLLLIITFIPVWTAAGAAYDLWYGPVEQLLPGSDQWELYLQYTGRWLGPVE